MAFFGIMRYTLSALIAAVCAGGLWLILRLFRDAGRLDRQSALRLASVAYMAALIQITALRIGLVSPRWLSGKLCLVPLQTTLDEARSGLWPLIYHLAGNMIWFVPLGWLLPGLLHQADVRKVIVTGAGVSAAIECVQFLMGTGVSDIDDIWLNALGALAGYGAARIWKMRPKV